MRRQAAAAPARSQRTIGSAAFGLACLCLLAVAAIVGPATAATAAGGECPNEEFRRGPSALLPECRAYELVSPALKEGGYVISKPVVHASPDGNGASFFSYSSFAGGVGSAWFTSYAARRGASNWGTQALDAPQFHTGFGLLAKASPVSSLYLTKTLQFSSVALLPGAIEGGANIYVQNNLTGQRELVAARESLQLFGEAAGGGVGLYVDGSRDWSHLMLKSRTALNGEVTDGPPHLYDFTGGSLHVIDVLPNGEIAPSAHIDDFSFPYAHAMSEDGSRAFFTVGEYGEGPLYLREDDSRTVPISASQRSEDAGTVYPAQFIAASANGSEVIFASNQQLTEGPSGGLYRYDVESGELTGLLPGPAGVNHTPFRVVAVSEDDSYVYLASTGAFAEGATTPAGEAANLYALHDGQIKWIGQTAIGRGEAVGTAPAEALASPDGAYFAFGSASPLTGPNPLNPACPARSTPPNQAESCMQVFVYEYASGNLTCVSCANSTLGHSDLGGTEAVTSVGYGDHYPHAVLDNGTVFFNTPNRLAPRDVNGTLDVYAWRDGVDSLISTGTSPSESTFAEATPDGSNVFFLTSQSLVKQDVDSSPDLYDARVDGGLVGQWPPDAPPPCEGDGCRTSSSAAPAGRAPGSAEAGGAGNFPARCVSVTRRAAKAARQADQLERRARRAGRAQARRLHRRAAKQQRQARRLKAKARNCGGQGR